MIAGAACPHDAISMAFAIRGQHLRILTLSYRFSWVDYELDVGWMDMIA